MRPEVLEAQWELWEGDLAGFRDGSVCWAGSGAMGAAADAEWLRWVTKQFGNVAGKEREISLEEFKSALQVKEVRDPWEGRNGILGKK